jgi:ketol-acid reductoisomerase
MLETALAYAKAIGSSRAAVFTSTFKEETETDLFGEQVILTGSIPMIIIESYKVLLEEGYDPLISWFVCFYELKTITNLMFEKGMESFYEMVSDTARYGGISRGRELIDDQFKNKMRKILKEIKDGSFDRELAKGLSEKNDIYTSKNIFDSKDFNEIEKKLLRKIKETN